MLLPITLVQPFVGVILWSWISFMNPHRLVYGASEMMPWAMMVFIGTLVGCVVAGEPKRSLANGVTVLIGVFLVMITFTTIFAVGPWNDVFSKYESVFKTFLFLLVTAALLTSRERIHALVWVMVLSLGFFAIKGGGFTLLTGGSFAVYGPPDSMIRDNNNLATALLVVLPLMNYLRTESRHAIVRNGIVAAMLLTLLAVIGSYSRGALLALAAVVGYFWLKSSKKLMIGMALAVALAGAIAFMPGGWSDRMWSIQRYDQDASAEGRLDVWHSAWIIAVSRPLVGGGFYVTYAQPSLEQFVPGASVRAVHSIWLEILAEHGFPTFFVWVGINVAAAVYARRIIKQATGVPGMEWAVNLAKMAQISMIAYLSGGTFLSLCYWDYYFTILVLVAATNELVRARSTESTFRSRLAANSIPARLALSRFRPTDPTQPKADEQVSRNQYQRLQEIPTRPWKRSGL
jgi:putative inorganic carbon (hco3(-)) transporter